MSSYLTEEEILVAIPGLTRVRLSMHIEARIIRPMPAGPGEGGEPLFRDLDLARLRLLYELSADLQLDEAAIEVIIGLIDQLHGTRRDLLTLTRAVMSEPREVRARIASALLRDQG